MEVFSLDSKRGVFVADTVDMAIVFAAYRFIRLGNDAIQEHGQFSVALSGGSTPKKLYEKLSHPDYASQLDWKKVKLFWSDERCVSPDNSESNYKMAMQFFSEGALSQATVFRMQGEREDREKAALDYENTIKEECPQGKLDLILLGLGDDGHTASLFPGTQALDVSNRLVVSNSIPEKKSWRLTMTFECLNDSKRMMLLAFGKDKHNAFQEVLQGNLPAGRLGRGEAPILFVVDAACYRG